MFNNLRKRYYKWRLKTATAIVSIILSDLLKAEKQMDRLYYKSERLDVYDTDFNIMSNAVNTTARMLKSFNVPGLEK